MAGLVFGAKTDIVDAKGKTKQSFWVKLTTLVSAVNAVSNNGFVTHAPHTRAQLVAGTPSAATAGAGAAVHVTDATGGAQPAWSDGTVWRYASGAVVT